MSCSSVSASMLPRRTRHVQAVAAAAIRSALRHLSPAPCESEATSKNYCAHNDEIVVARAFSRHSLRDGEADVLMAAAGHSAMWASACLFSNPRSCHFTILWSSNFYLRVFIKE